MQKSVLLSSSNVQYSLLQKSIQITNDNVSAQHVESRHVSDDAINEMNNNFDNVIYYAAHVSDVQHIANVTLPTARYMLRCVILSV